MTTKQSDKAVEAKVDKYIETTVTMSNNLPAKTNSSGKPAKQWDLVQHQIAVDLACGGKTKTEIAKEYSISVATINAWMKSPDYKALVNEVIESEIRTYKNKRLQLLMKTLAAREEIAEINGYANFSDKDSLDVIKELRIESGDDSASANSNYAKLFGSLLKHSVENQPKIIVQE